MVKTELELVMDTTQVYIKFLSRNGDYYVSVQEYIDNHQDSYQDDQDPLMYKKTSNGFEVL